MLSVSQKKFCADGDASKFENYKWQVPVTVRVQGREGVEPFLLKEKEMEFRLPGVDPNSWIKVHASVACIPHPWCSTVAELYASCVSCVMLLDSLVFGASRPCITCCQGQLMWYP